MFGERGSGVRTSVPLQGELSANSAPMCNSALCGGSRTHRANRGSAAVRSVRLAPSYQNNNLSWCEAPLAVEHPRETENPPGTPSGRNSERLRWRMKRGISTAAVRERENSESRSVSGERQRGYRRLDDHLERLFPLFKGESHAGA